MKPRLQNTSLMHSYSFNSPFLCSPPSLMLLFMVLQAGVDRAKKNNGALHFEKSHISHNKVWLRHIPIVNYKCLCLNVSARKHNLVTI